jgi:hypothetical protein
MLMRAPRITVALAVAVMTAAALSACAGAPGGASKADAGLCRLVQIEGPAQAALDTTAADSPAGQYGGWSSTQVPSRYWFGVTALSQPLRHDVNAIFNVEREGAQPGAAVTRPLLDDCGH